MQAQEKAKHEWHMAQLHAMHGEAERVRKEVDRKIVEHLKKAQEGAGGAGQAHDELRQALVAMDELKARSAESEEAARSQRSDMAGLRGEMEQLMRQLDATQADLAHKTRELHARRQEAMRLARAHSEEAAELRRTLEEARAACDDEVAVERSKRAKSEQHAALSERQLEDAKEKAEAALARAEVADAACDVLKARAADVTRKLDNERLVCDAVTEENKRLAEKLRGAEDALEASEADAAALREAAATAAAAEQVAAAAREEAAARDAAAAAWAEALLDAAAGRHAALATRIGPLEAAAKTAAAARSAAEKSAGESGSRGDALAAQVAELQAAAEEAAARHAAAAAAAEAAAAAAAEAARSEKEAAVAGLREEIEGLQRVQAALREVAEASDQARERAEELTRQQEGLKASFHQLRVCSLRWPHPCARTTTQVNLLQSKSSNQLLARHFALLWEHRKKPDRRELPADSIGAPGYQRSTVRIIFLFSSFFLESSARIVHLDDLVFPPPPPVDHRCFLRRHAWRSLPPVRLKAKRTRGISTRTLHPAASTLRYARSGSTTAANQQHAPKNRAGEARALRPSPRDQDAEGRVRGPQRTPRRRSRGADGRAGLGACGAQGDVRRAALAGGRCGAGVGGEGGRTRGPRAGAGAGARGPRKWVGGGARDAGGGCACGGCRRTAEGEGGVGTADAAVRGCSCEAVCCCCFL